MQQIAFKGYFWHFQVTSFYEKHNHLILNIDFLQAGENHDCNCPMLCIICGCSAALTSIDMSSSKGYVGTLQTKKNLELLFKHPHLEERNIHHEKWNYIRTLQLSLPNICNVVSAYITPARNRKYSLTISIIQIDIWQRSHKDGISF